RLAVGLHGHAGTRGVDRHAVATQRLTRHELEDARGAHDFTLALGEGLAFLARQQAAEVVGARHDQRPGLVEQVGAYFGAGIRPAREGRFRGGDRTIYRLLVATRHFRDHVARI